MYFVTRNIYENVSEKKDYYTDASFFISVEYHLGIPGKLETSLDFVNGMIA